jgi:hypothetical protein
MPMTSNISVRVSVCLCIYVSTAIFWMLEPVTINLCMHTMAPEPILTTDYVNPFHQPVCLYIHPAVVARQRIGREFYNGNKYTHNNRRIVVKCRSLCCSFRMKGKYAIRSSQNLLYILIYLTTLNQLQRV